jgi:hypothetical protein
MTDAHPANQSRNSGRIKDVPDHAVRLALVKAALGPASDDTAGILASMLEEGEPLADVGGGIHLGIMKEEPKYATHCGGGIRCVSDHDRDVSHCFLTGFGTGKLRCSLERS